MGQLCLLSLQICVGQVNLLTVTSRLVFIFNTIVYSAYYIFVSGITVWYIFQSPCLALALPVLYYCICFYFIPLFLYFCHILYSCSHVDTPQHKVQYTFPNK
jgi:hypothetical protein